MWQNIYTMQENYVSSTNPTTDNFGSDLLLGIGNLIYLKGRYTIDYLHIKKIEIILEKISGPSTAPVDIFTLNSDFNIHLTYNTQPTTSDMFATTISDLGGVCSIDMTKGYKTIHHGLVIRCNSSFVLKNARLAITYAPSILLQPTVILYDTVTLNWKELRFVKSWSYEKTVLKRSLSALMTSPTVLLDTQQKNITSFVDNTVQANTVYYYMLEFYSAVSGSGILTYSGPAGYFIQNSKGEINGVARLKYHPQTDYNYTLDGVGYVYDAGVIKFNAGKILLV